MPAISYTWVRFAFERDPLTFAWYMPGTRSLFDFSDGSRWDLTCQWVRNGETVLTVPADDIIGQGINPNVVVPVPAAIESIPPACYSILLSAVDLNIPGITPQVFDGDSLPTFLLRPTPTDDES